MVGSKVTIASLCGAALCLSPVALHAKERLPAPVEDSENLEGGPAVSAIGYILGVAVVVIITVLALDEDEDVEEPASP